MVAINFKAQFADDVEDGTKRQTIRQKARCKPGDTLQLYTGMRQKGCRLLGTAVCLSVTPIKINATDMELDGRMLLAGHATRGDLEDRDDDFAQKDGFKGFTEMAEWFEKTYGKLPFVGFVIKWGELK